MMSGVYVVSTSEMEEGAAPFRALQAISKIFKSILGWIKSHLLVLGKSHSEQAAFYQMIVLLLPGKVCCSSQTYWN